MGYLECLAHQHHDNRTSAFVKLVCDKTVSRDGLPIRYLLLLLGTDKLLLVAVHQVTAAFKYLFSLSFLGSDK